MRLSGFPKGMDNVHSDTEIPMDALRRAVNVDILDSGKVRRRKGHALINPVSGAHSLWSDNKNKSYLVHNNVIKAVLDGGATQDIGVINSNGNRVSYVKVNDDVYFSCATAKGKISNGVIKPWGIETPTTPPVAIESIGILNAGTYHLAMTFVLNDGRESGASTLSSVILNNDAGITITGMPVPTSPDVVKKRLYVTTANGETLFMARELNPLDQFASVSNDADGQELRTAYLTEPVFSTGLAEVNGRIFMIDASNPKTVVHTEAFVFDYVDSRKNFYQFPVDVTLIAATRSGLYVCADKTYFIQAAGTDESSQVEIFDYTGMANTVQMIPSTHEPIWLSERGAVIGHEGGNAEILSSSSLATGTMSNAASMVREQDGIRQYVVVGQQEEASTVQAGTYAEAEITRRVV